MLASLLTALIVTLRRWEQRLRRSESVSAEARRISRLIFTARLVVVWLAAAGAVGSLLAAVQDPRCSAAA